MSFRTRLALLCAAALAIALIAAGVAAYEGERISLGDQLDALLRARAEQVTPDVVQRVLAADQLLPKQRDSGRGSTGGAEGGQPVAHPSGNAVPGFGDLELVLADGTRAVGSSSAMAKTIPPVGASTQIARGARSSLFQTSAVAGGSLRIYVFSAASGVAGEVAAPLTQLDDSLHDLRLVFAGIGLGALLLVMLLASIIARQALRPVAALSRAAENVIATGDLRQRVAVSAATRDELASLATTVNAMLDALERSVGAQRQLVADASHELRTPLTTLLANLQLLDEPGGLENDDAPELVAEARRQAEELGSLVSDLVELARSSEIELHVEELRLDLVAAAALQRIRGHAEDVVFDVHLSPCTVPGDAGLLERAIGNLLDNAAKWTPAGGRVELIVDAGEVLVRDEGPGIAAADLPFVFQRFYRSAMARGRSGSGLGLAIVRQVAELHGGDVTATSTIKGAVLRLRLPGRDGP